MSDASLSQRYLCFSLGNEKFALPLLQVREVIAPPKITPIPQAPAFCLGLMNLRGEVITVLDLRKKFSIQGEDSSELSVVICELGKVSVGLMVDQINQVLSPRPEDLSERPSVAGGKFSEAITGVCRLDKALVLFVDINRALDGVDLQGLSQGKAA